MVIGTTLNGRFSLDKELGRGGMGTVFRATDQVLQRTVAIKILKDLTGEEVGCKVRLEAQILARLLHENVVRLYDFNVDDGTYYFIMEEVDGTSFQKRWKKIPMIERTRIIAQVAEALDYAHHQGVIHRDVKPANVLLTAADQAKLSDFGLSLLMDATQETGVVKGTPHYMSPEQAKGRRLDHRTDLYALGIILYECATGTPPFLGQLISIMAQHVNTAPEPPRQRNAEITEELERLILSLIAKHPEERPSSGREVAEHLRDLIGRQLLWMHPGTEEPLTEVPSTTEGQTNSGSGSGISRRTPVTRMGAVPSFGSDSGAGASVGPMTPPTAVGGRSTTPSPDQDSRNVNSRSRSAMRLARDLIQRVEAEPIALDPEQRYLAGHYLGYLLGGSRRRGFLRRRPLDPLNADRARLLLAMTFLMVDDDDEPAVTKAASLMDLQPDVRPALNPVIVAKYLASRDNPKKRKHFRRVRQRLQEASTYASRNLLDVNGVLNPGLMPQVFDDLKRLAPERSEVDDELVQRWNRVTEVWRGNPEFRNAVLHYATTRAWKDPASVNLWPEVVYPLIERARWQRRRRSGTEAFWDAVCERIHLPDAGVRMDRAFHVAVPEPVVAHLDLALDSFEEDPSLTEGQPVAVSTSGLHAHVSPASFHDLEIEDEGPRDLIRQTSPDPVRLTLGDLRGIWQEAIAALRSGAPPTQQRHMPLGPYRVTVVASIRSRSAGQVAIQGMVNKQIELLVPSFTGSGSDTRPILAAWLYQNQSLVISYIDNLGSTRYVLWDTSTNHQTNFAEAADLNHSLFQIGLEAPDQLDRALSKRFRPRNPV